MISKFSPIFLICFSFLLTFCSNKIDREALVKRHIPSLSEADTLSPFTVGNGEFAYTVDITGLQTFAEEYDNSIPLGTQSQWGWHSTLNTGNYNTYGRDVSYASKQSSDAGQWLRANPHRLHLGKIGFSIIKPDSSQIKLSDVKNINQSEDIWEGIIKSSFTVEGTKINVATTCHPELDQIAVKVKTDMLRTGMVGIKFDFPYGSSGWGKNAADWNNPGSHSSELVSQAENSAVIKRTLDTTIYYVNISWAGTAVFNKTKAHSFILSINDGDTFKFTCNFSKKENTGTLPGAENTFKASKEKWKNFWETGGALDLSESKDPRAIELERRIVLSRYLTAVQCAGSLPPQETGLTFNSWYGKPHLEMHWWHGVQFVLWEKPELFEKSLSFYKTIMPKTKQYAERQGYKGVRWQKMVGPEGSNEGPSEVGVFLIWQQPHPIYYAELLYMYYKDQATRDNYKEIVFETAEFMASYAHWDESTQRYVLGPPLIPAQEIYKPDSTINPAFELAYWNFGLRTAQKWRERLGLQRNEKWDHVINNLSKLPENNGFYQNAENALNTFEDKANRKDHPTLVAPFGMLPGFFDANDNNEVDVEIMRSTLKQVMKSWDWRHTWGWDYPMIAMTAARIGEPEIAIDALLMDVQKNTYLNNGHNYQNETLTIYLPGNGGLLTAVAMMAAGWDGSPDIKAPGFPKDGNWVVKYEGLKPLL
ncbi:MAG: glycoside hydrolase family 65 [Ignavibacteria bacterium]|jgi:hypothetical protein